MNRVYKSTMYEFYNTNKSDNLCLKQIQKSCDLDIKSLIIEKFSQMFFPKKNVSIRQNIMR